MRCGQNQAEITNCLPLPDSVCPALCWVSRISASFQRKHGSQKRTTSHHLPVRISPDSELPLNFALYDSIRSLTQTVTCDFCLRGSDLGLAVFGCPKWKIGKFKVNLNAGENMTHQVNFMNIFCFFFENEVGIRIQISFEGYLLDYIRNELRFADFEIARCNSVAIFDSTFICRFTYCVVTWFF